LMMPSTPCFLSICSIVKRLRLSEFAIPRGVGVNLCKRV
jgi:hypothetical protein